MGAWGVNNFENDSALDWINDFVCNPSLVKLEEPVLLVLEKDEFIDSEESFATLAASEIIAAFNNLPATDLQVDVKPMEFTIPEETISKAIQAIYKILYFEHHSELRELWQETDEFEQWASVQADLINRLKNCLKLKNS